MKNSVLNEIKEFAVKKLNQNYGYCGLAKGEKKCMLNSDDGQGNDIKIHIEIKPE